MPKSVTTVPSSYYKEFIKNEFLHAAKAGIMPCCWCCKLFHSSGGRCAATGPVAFSISLLEGRLHMVNNNATGVKLISWQRSKPTYSSCDLFPGGLCPCSSLSLTFSQLEIHVRFLKMILSLEADDNLKCLKIKEHHQILITLSCIHLLQPHLLMEGGTQSK